MSEAECDYLRKAIADSLRKVPTKVNNGPVHMARDFKKFYKDAMALLGKSRATKEQLNGLHNKTLDWYA
jgi:hypothetical protein